MHYNYNFIDRFMKKNSSFYIYFNFNVKLSFSKNIYDFLFILVFECVFNWLIFWRGLFYLLNADMDEVAVSREGSRGCKWDTLAF